MNFFETPWVCAAAAIFGLLAGLAIRFRPAQEAAADIQQQLAGFATLAVDQPLQLRPLLDATPVAAGWNVLRERCRQQEDVTDLRAALAHTGIGDDSRTIMDLLPEGVVQTDGMGAIRYLNPAAALLLEQSSDRPLLGACLVELLTAAYPANAESVRQRVSRPQLRVTVDAFRGAAIAEGVLRLCRVRTDGKEVWTLRDLTQQKLAEEARNQFVMTATHELRTPLTNIRALAEMIALEKEINIEDQKRFCNTINAEATRLSRFIDELLDLSSLEAGALHIQPAETDLSRLLDEVVEHVRPEAERKGIALETQFPGKLPRLKLDKDKFLGALVNLLGNAVKYTPDGGRVRLHVESDVESASLQFHVEDSGIGIAPGDLPRVFEKFYRSEDPQVREASGSGLGLAFTQEVAKAHGGRVTVASELRKGSRFSLHLPVRAAEVTRV